MLVMLIGAIHNFYCTKVKFSLILWISTLIFFHYIKKASPPQACRGDVLLQFWQRKLDTLLSESVFHCRKMLHRQMVGSDSKVEKITIFVANGESTWYFPQGYLSLRLLALQREVHISQERFCWVEAFCIRDKPLPEWSPVCALYIWQQSSPRNLSGQYLRGSFR